MSSVSSIAISGIAEASVRMQKSANRIANISSSGPLTVSDAADRMKPFANAAAPSTVATFKPDARFAASYGLLSGPDIDLAGEIIEHLISSTSLIAIAHVIRADAKMVDSLLDIKV
jgi:flagellar basal body rod protein FlgC